MKYHFLILCSLLLVPGAVIFAARHDLRRPILTMGACSLPFAFTEFLFYPTYWEPEFLFNLANKIGFGVEDFLFVFGLAAFSSTAYAFCFKRRFGPNPGSPVWEVATGGGVPKAWRDAFPQPDRWIVRFFAW
jgi:hypothetical protein